MPNEKEVEDEKVCEEIDVNGHFVNEKETVALNPETGDYAEPVCEWDCNDNYKKENNVCVPKTEVVACD